MDSIADADKVVYLCSPHGYFDIDPATGSVSSAGHPDTGGQTVYVVELAKALGRAGTPTFLVVRWFDVVKPELRKLGPNAWIVRIRAGDLVWVAKEQIYGLLPELTDNLVEFIEGRWAQMFADAGITPPKSVQPALFHGHYVDGGIVAEQAARHFNVPFYWTSHSLGPLKRERMKLPVVGQVQFNFPHRIVQEARLIKAALATGGLTVTARTEVADIKRFWGVDASAAEFIPPGVDVVKFHRHQGFRKKTEGWPTTEPVILVGGRIAATKGYILALMAFRKVLKEFPTANFVHFGGSKIPSKEEAEVMGELEQYRNEHGITRRVHFLGGQEHDDLPGIYRQADVFVMPSVHEPFGMVALEAAASGTPVVISSHAGISKELLNGRDCLTAVPEDTDGLANAMLSLLKDRGLARRLGDQALETINGNFRWEVIATRHVEFWGKARASP